jgi:peptidylprolyl isomerase
MEKAKHGDIVRVQYIGCLEDGTVFSQTKKEESLKLTLGKGEVIPGFENAIVGMEPDESKTIKVRAEDAFGPHRDDLIKTVDRNKLPEDLHLEIGERLKIPRQDGQTTSVTVTNLSEKDVTLDANHHLSGKDLIFDIKLLEIIGTN